MGDLQFALVREGSSDDGLVTHIRELLIRAGATQVVGAPRQYRGTVLEKIQQVLQEPIRPGLIFVHRDSDSSDASSRQAEIVKAADAMGCVDQVVAVVPVQELEAWLLTDESAIRAVVGKPSGRASLGLPTVGRIEATPSPKEILRAACLLASEKSGARRRKESSQFDVRRATLLERLDIDGVVAELPSWQKFVADLEVAAALALQGE
ncbi:uncharacterized protein DUF4276 [Microbacterium sp. AG1240]|uniref:DUF4276 family protein n=1 Tax=Microbacterium sp. AG1240 TaxID=2183992 RepID=UPI000EAE87D1|nr:DUF4276 family protein [Microbacterium sp. AG1240]RKT31444.1 uncharacterized protein DUF4276 [Microbacterium sp. AG1240]